LVASKRERIELVLRAITDAHPFESLDDARAALERVMRQVEDEYSGIPEDPQADEKTVSDGRMYPPTDRREIKQGCKSVRTFRHVGHKTSFGMNGSILIETLDGAAILDLAGKDGRSVNDLRRENVDE
jgi:hypothetical protein